MTYMEILVEGNVLAGFYQEGAGTLTSNTETYAKPALEVSGIWSLDSLSSFLWAHRGCSLTASNTVFRAGVEATASSKMVFSLQGKFSYFNELEKISL